jgi:hypothetical protein
MKCFTPALIFFGSRKYATFSQRPDTINASIGRIPYEVVHTASVSFRRLEKRQRFSQNVLSCQLSERIIESLTRFAKYNRVAAKKDFFYMLILAVISVNEEIHLDTEMKVIEALAKVYEPGCLQAA